MLLPLLFFRETEGKKLTASLLAFLRMGMKQRKTPLRRRPE